MGKRYWVAGENVQAACRETMKQFHADLFSMKVNVLCVFAKAEDKKGNVQPAVKLRGRACYATIRAVSDEDRAAGMPDAVMTIDHVLWETLSPERQVALLDHELTHIELSGGESSAGVSLAMRKHDWELSGFFDVVKRHGKDAIELVDLIKFGRSEPGQLAFRFIEDGEPLKETSEVVIGWPQKATKATKKSNPNEGQSDEALISQAIEVLRATKRASTSGLQRRLKIGYNRAAAIIDALEERGIVGPATEEGPRDILKLPEVAA